jgi:hypothetical protein
MRLQPLEPFGKETPAHLAKEKRVDRSALNFVSHYSGTTPYMLNKGQLLIVDCTVNHSSVDISQKTYLTLQMSLPKEWAHRLF